MKIFKLSTLNQISIVHLVSHIHMMVLPALMPLISIRTDIKFVEIGIAISVFNIVSAFTQAPMGFLVDKLGAARVLFGGLILGSLSFLSLSLITNYYWLIAAMAIAGLANAVYHPADYAILSRSIEEHRMGRAFSIHTFSGYVGTAITPFMMLFLADLVSIELAYFVAGIVGIFAALVMLPTAMLPRSDVPTSQATSTLAKAQPTGRRSLLTSSVVLMLVLFLLLSLSGSSIQNFSVSAFVTGYHLPLGEANMALTAFLVASAIGVLSGGHLADYTQRHGIIAACALIVTAAMAVIVANTDFSAGALTVILAIMGFLFGIIAPSRDMLVRAASPKGAEGRVFGIVSTGFNIGGTVGPILFAWIIDGGHPRGIFWCSGLFMLLTAMIALYQEWQGKHKAV